MKIPLSRPFMGTEEGDAVLEVIKSRFIACGQTTRAFENALTRKFNRKYCIVVNSGTSALYLSLKVLGIKQVIVPSITSIAVLNAALNADSKPIFADIEPETHNIDLSTLAKRQLEEADGIIATQTYGHSADMDELEYYVKNYHLSLIEDFAQAAGGFFKNRILGSFGKISVTSFYGTKIMTAGHGGAILTDDSEVYQKCLYACGEATNYCYNNIIPMNLRMTDIQSAIGLVQLKKLDRMVDMRRSAAHKLTALLTSLELKLPVEKPDVKHTYYKYHLVLPEHMQKQAFIKEMGKRDVAIGTCFDPPLHKTWLAKNMLNTDTELPVSENIAPRTVSLPIFPEITDGDISRICRAVNALLENSKISDR